MSEARHAQLFGPGPDNLEDCSRLKGYQLNACHAMNEAKRQQHRQQQIPKKGDAHSKQMPLLQAEQTGCFGMQNFEQRGPRM